MKASTKLSRLTLRCPTTLAAVPALLGVPQLASAVQMSTYVSTIQQWGTGSSFHLGHTVMASTNYNNLSAGGTYIVQCNHPATLPVTGERALATGGFVGPIRLTVTIPAQQPALRNISGWLQVPAETLLSCNYRWTAFATESGYTASAGGVGVQYGSGSERAGDTVDFTMYRRTRPEDAGGGCTP